MRLYKFWLALIIVFAALIAFIYKLSKTEGIVVFMSVCGFFGIIAALFCVANWIQSALNKARGVEDTRVNEGEDDNWLNGILLSLWFRGPK